MENLREETLRVLKEYEKTIEDIKFITDGLDLIDIESFFIKIDRLYDNGYGCAEVVLNLKIFGDNWWLERDEYDGAEGWEFKVMPIKPNSKPVYNYSPFYDDED